MVDDVFCVFVTHVLLLFFFFFSSRRRHTRSDRDWSSDVCSSDLYAAVISWPSSRTRRAIVSSSKTIRLSSRPPVCLRLAVLGNIHPYRPGSGPREIVSTPVDSGHPQNGFAACDHRVAGPVAAGHSRFH